MNVFTLEEKRGKIYINTAAIFVHKFYIRKFIVSLVSFWKKKLKLLQILLQELYKLYGDMIVVA